MDDNLMSNSEFEGFYPEWVDLSSYDTTRDLLKDIEPMMGRWQLHGSVFTDGREAALLCGRLFPFHTGVKVIRQEDKYFILYWNKGETL